MQQSAETTRFDERTSNGDLTRRALDALRGKWGPAVWVAGIYFAVNLAISGAFKQAGGLVSLVVTGPFTLGLSIFFLELLRGGTPSFSRMFDGFQRFATALAAHLLMMVFILLWALLLIVPGVVAALSYSLTWFIMADNQEVGPLEALRTSKEMMRGHKTRMLLLMLRFFGWALLCVLTLGIGFLWLFPYIYTTLAAFYEDLRPAEGAAGTISRWM